MCESEASSDDHTTLPSPPPPPPPPPQPHRLRQLKANTTYGIQYGTVPDNSVSGCLTCYCWFKPHMHGAHLSSLPPSPSIPAIFHRELGTHAPIVSMLRVSGCPTTMRRGRAPWDELVLDASSTFATMGRD